MSLVLTILGFIIGIVALFYVYEKSGIIPATLMASVYGALSLSLLFSKDYALMGALGGGFAFYYCFGFSLKSFLIGEVTKKVTKKKK